MAEQLKVGIIGCGAIAENKHVPAIVANGKKAKLVAVSDVKVERAERVSAIYSKCANEQPKVYTDYRYIIEDKDIDVVHICTPNSTHSEIAVAAMEAHKHVLCEKPIAHSLEAAQKMIDVSRKTGRKLTISHQNRFREDSQAIFQACRNGILGEIYFAKAHALRRKAVPSWGSFTSKKFQGGGPLIDIGVHALDLVLWFMDNYEVKSVTGSVFQKMRDNCSGNIYGPWDPNNYDVEDSAFGFIKMTNGATIFLEASWALNIRNPKEAMTTLCGTLGGAEQFQGEFGPGSYSYAINTILNDRMVTITPDPPYRYSWRAPKRANELMEEAPQLEFSTWFDAILEDKSPVVLPEQAYTVLMIVDALYKSAETGKTIYFD